MILEYIVENKKYQNINQILKQEFNISSRLLHKLITYKHVFLNGVVADTRNNISVGDIISVNLDFEEEKHQLLNRKFSLV